MESMEKALARASQRMSPEALAPVTVRSLSDIRRILAEFDPAANVAQPKVEVAATLEGKAADGRHQRFAVKAETQSKSKRDMLLEGLNVLKQKAEADYQAEEAAVVNGVNMKAPKISNDIGCSSWIDPLIKQWTGGERRGLCIVWVVDGEEYKYDPYRHKLMHVVNDA